MEHLTAEQITKQTDHLEGVANIRAINKLYRAQDTSNLWPIEGRFNVTERAIKIARKHRTLWIVQGPEYCYLLESIFSEIINAEA